MPTPSVLLDPALAPVWRAVAAALDRRGLDDRRDVPLPAGLDPQAHRLLGSLLGRHFPTTKHRLPLAAVERGLARHDVELLGLLADAGCAPVGRRDLRTAARDRREAARTTLATTARERLGDDPWVAAWTERVGPTVADAETARAAVDTVERVLAVADAPGVRSRAEVAAQALGQAHRLDGGPERRWVGVALALRAGATDPADPGLWADAGLPGDLVSSPVLTWALPLRGAGLPAVVRAATASGAPMPLTALSLRDLTVDVPPGTVVLSVENPRLLEAAVQRGGAGPVVCSSGNPRRPFLALVAALRAAGAVVRHHGDVDLAGLAVTARLTADHGVVPWMMDAATYRAEVARAADEGVSLPAVDPAAAVPPTPWDPALAEAVAALRRAVEEERVLETLLGGHR